MKKTYLYIKNNPFLRNKKNRFLKKSAQKISSEVLPDLLNDPLVGLKTFFYTKKQQEKHVLKHVF